MKNQLTCFIGRFQPWHKGHEHILQNALANSEYVLIICGSSNLHPCAYNPWSFSQRKSYITSCITKAHRSRVLILPLIDYLYNESAWLRDIKKLVEKAKIYFNLPSNTKITWIGHHKLDCSYLKSMPCDHYIEVNNYQNINGSDIRKALQTDLKTNLTELLPGPMVSWLKKNPNPYLECIVKKALTINLVIIYKNKVLFLKDDGAYRLPGFAAKGQNIELTKKAFINSWYDLNCVTWGDTHYYNNKIKSCAESTRNQAHVASVDFQVDDTELIWCDVSRFKRVKFWYNHASIAYYVLQLKRG